MEFGITLPSYQPEATVDGLRQAALLAEELGFDSAWTTDHVIIGKDSPQPYHSIFEAVTTLGWLAAITHRLKLGISVLIMAQRHPVVIAKEIATLDQLSGGRIILGVGTGYMDDEFAHLNAEFHNRGARLSEGIEVLRHLWSGSGQPFQGKHYRLSNYSFGPLPAQPGGPQIWIGGESDAALKRAATLGDAWHSTRISPDEFKACAAKVRSFAAGRTVRLTARVTVGEQRGAQPGPRGSNYFMGGSAQEIADDVRRYQDAGSSHIALNFWHQNLPAMFEQMKRFAGEVRPKLT